MRAAFLAAALLVAAPAWGGPLSRECVRLSDALAAQLPTMSSQRANALDTTEMETLPIACGIEDRALGKRLQAQLDQLEKRAVEYQQNQWGAEWAKKARDARRAVEGDK